MDLEGIDLKQQSTGALSHLSAELGTISDEQWQKIAPNKDGPWLMKCGENDHEAEDVDVKYHNGELYAVDCAIGCVPVDMYHNGLTDCQWRCA